MSPNAARYSPDEAEDYLEHRRRQGFTVVHVMIHSQKSCSSLRDRNSKAVMAAFDVPDGRASGFNPKISGHSEYYETARGGSSFFEALPSPHRVDGTSLRGSPAEQSPGTAHRSVHRGR